MNRPSRQIDWPAAIVMVTAMLLGAGLLLLVGLGVIALGQIVADLILRIVGCWA